MTLDKKMEVISQISELLDLAKKDLLDNFIDKAFKSGALTEEMQRPASFLLAKFILTAYFNKKPFGPLDSGHKKDLVNLEYFL